MLGVIINKKMLKELEPRYRNHFPDELKQYLLVQYGQEPFPYEFSEQDLYTNINHDIRAYEAGALDVTVKSPAQRWQEEREYLQNLYVEKALEVRELSDYVTDLENMLSEHGLESPRMTERRIELSKITAF